MRFDVRWMMLGAAGIVIGLLAVTTRADDGKDLRPDIIKLSDAFEKKNDAEVKKQTAAVAKEVKELGDDLMHLFKPRKSKGLGVGTKAGVATPDGIEAKLEELADKPINANDLATQSRSLEEMGYNIAAIAEVALAKKPAKDEGKKKVKDWEKWSVDMKAAGLELAEAAKKKSSADVKKAADKANTTCTKCHDIFRFEQK